MQELGIKVEHKGGSVAQDIEQVSQSAVRYGGKWK
jgi:hypothetical protein